MNINMKSRILMDFMRRPGRCLRFNTAHPGFTLVELIVVISIISVLLGILLPVLGKVRRDGRRTVCMAQLHNIGMAMRMYVSDNDETMPVAAQLPSAEPNLPCITEVMLPYLKTRKIMRCPSDCEYNYFEKEGTSYEYPHYLRGKRVNNTFLGKHWGEANVPVLFDFGPFHNKAGRPHAINFLFGDGRVGDLDI